MVALRDPDATLLAMRHSGVGRDGLLRPAGARSVVAGSLLLKHQLLILNRERTHRALGGNAPAPSARRAANINSSR